MRDCDGGIFELSGKEVGGGGMLGTVRGDTVCVVSSGLEAGRVLSSVVIEGVDIATSGCGGLGDLAIGISAVLEFVWNRVGGL